MSTSMSPAQLSALLNGPAITPPPGVVADPNGDNVPNLNSVFIATVAICLSISSVLVLMRLYTRLVVIRKNDASDFLCLLCYFAFIGFTGLFAKFVAVGGGRHTWDVPLINVGNVTYWFLMAAMSYDITMILIKTSILVQYRKLFVPAKKTDFMWWGTWLLTAAVWIFYITAGLIQILFCKPVEKTWNPLVPGTCIDSNANELNVIASSFNVGIDTVMLAMPLISISRLHLDQKRRFAIGSVFLVGLFACVSASLRVYYSYLLATTTDALYNAMRLGLWAYAETTSGIIVACMPIIPRFVQKTVRESAVYLRIASSVRSLVSTLSRGGQSKAYSSGYAQDLSGRYNPRGASSERHFNKAGSMESGSNEVELSESVRKADGILRTVDIHTHRE